MSLDDYLTMNHVPIYASVVIERAAGSCVVLRSFEPIPRGGNRSAWTVGSGPDPAAIVALPPRGGYLVGVKDGSPFPLALRLRGPEGAEDGPTLPPGKLLQWALRGMHGLKASIPGEPPAAGGDDA